MANSTAFGQYRATPPTIADTKTSIIQVDQRGNTKVTDQGQYNATPLLLADGETAPRQVDSTGNEKVTLATGLSEVNDHISTHDSVYAYTYIATATTTTAKAGAGRLKGILIGETAAGAITIYDNTAGSGTVIGVLKASIVEGFYEFDCAFATGLTIVTAATSKITVIWE